MGFATRKVFLRFRTLAPAGLLVWALAFGASVPVRAEPFFFFWDRPGQPERREPEQPSLTGRQVRAILAREGARMVGKPHLRGDEMVAIGRDREGGRKRFTLDAVSGEVLDVELIAPPPERRRLEERRRDNPDDLAPPDRPLPPPEHAPHGDDTLAAPPPAPASANPAQNPAKADAPAAARQAPAQQPESDDAALSPIKPLHPRGAPKVEPLPQ